MTSVHVTKVEKIYQMKSVRPKKFLGQHFLTHLPTAQAIADGRVYFDFDFTAPYPAEHIVFRSHLVGDYLEEIL